MSTYSTTYLFIAFNHPDPWKWLSTQSCSKQSLFLVICGQLWFYSLSSFSTAKIVFLLAKNWSLFKKKNKNHKLSF